MTLLGLSLVTIALFVGFGLVVGVLFGFFGMGGSFLVTPALLVLGYPATVAVGSGLAFVFGTSVVGALRHRTHGQIDYTLAASLTVSMTVGIEVGRRAVVVLDAFGSADLVIGVAYVVLLALVGLFTLRDARRESDARSSVDLADRVRAFACPPMVTVAGGVRVSVWVILALGGAVGTLSGLLGVGGGFLLLPAMLYGLGVPAGVAVGTDVLQITVSGAFGTFVYARLGAVSLPVVGSLLVGSAFGARIGAGASTLVEEDELKEYFAAVLLAGSLAVALETLSTLFGVAALNTASVVLVFGAATAVSAAIVRAAIGRVRASASRTPNALRAE
ncbi:sulfite exporter TauE/SafE family protein [Natrialbaceae archaeon GCM10025810]|uniref:sulfite exporter TauE/SafE family protein n=1 Tax=Halovalidus salilacus TaxID=3075124 RepID=UPI0036126E96